MKDAIDKRNERERIARSIVKRRNVVYNTKEELERRQEEERRQQQLQIEREAAEEIMRRLREEEEDDKRRKAMEIEQLLAEQEELEKQLKSGQYIYGANPMDGITQEKVEAILSEKRQQLQILIEAANNNNTVEQKAEPVEEAVSEDDWPDRAASEKEMEEAAQAVLQEAAGNAAKEVPEVEEVFKEI